MLLWGEGWLLSCSWKGVLAPELWVLDVDLVFLCCHFAHSQTG